MTGAAYPGGEQHVLNTSLILNWDIANGTITSYTGYADADSSQVIDADFDVRPNDAGTMDIARGGTVVDFSTDTRMLSQELRYASNFDGPVQLTVGALYWDENVDQTEQGLSALRFPFGSPAIPVTSICSPLKPRACPTTSRATLTAVLYTGSSSGIPRSSSSSVSRAATRARLWT